MQDFVAVEMGEAAEVEVVVGDEGIDERGTFVERRVESGKRGVKVVVEVFGEGRGEGSLGGGGDEAAFLEVEERFAGTEVVERFDAEVVGDGEEKGNRKSGKWKVESDELDDST